MITHELNRQSRRHLWKLWSGALLVGLLLVVPLVRLAAQSGAVPQERSDEAGVMLRVEEGCFPIGSTPQITASSALRVCVTDFWLSKHEVTNGEYAACVTEGGCQPPALDRYFTDLPRYGDYPVVHVTWEQAVDYAVWLSDKLSTEEDERVFRLPTEAEWEYAARGPENWLYPWGDSIQSDSGEPLANICDDSCDSIDREDYTDGYPELAPVGSFPAGASWIGALDMAGNVAEWVGDWYAVELVSWPVLNPTGPAEGEERVIRGGSWRSRWAGVQTIARSRYVPDDSVENVGFRIVEEIPLPPEAIIRPTETPTPVLTRAPYCGDDICQPGENEGLNCPGDCGWPTALPGEAPPAGSTGGNGSPPEPTPSTCGNGVCNPKENASNCPLDCLPTDNPPPPPPEDPPAEETPPTCGNGVCNPKENASNCPLDCPPS